MHSVPVWPHIIKQVDLDLCSLPEVDSYCHLIASIDYFTKWLKAKPIRNKTALTVASFLYELICLRGCLKVQINGQGREFVNVVCSCLHDFTGVKQRITSAYHPQSNGLVKRQNRTTKNALVKALDTHPEDSTHINEGVFLTHRVSRNLSTKISPFF